MLKPSSFCKTSCFIFRRILIIQYLFSQTKQFSNYYLCYGAVNAFWPRKRVICGLGKLRYNFRIHPVEYLYVGDLTCIAPSTCFQGLPQCEAALWQLRFSPPFLCATRHANIRHWDACFFPPVFPYCRWLDSPHRLFVFIDRKLNEMAATASATSFFGLWACVGTSLGKHFVSRQKSGQILPLIFTHFWCTQLHNIRDKQMFAWFVPCDYFPPTKK